MALEPVWLQKMAEKSLTADVLKAENASACNLEFKLPKSCFLESKEYSQLLKTQNKLHSSHFVLIYQKQNSPENKLGYVVSKKNAALAVKRNLCKRIIRESFRTHQHCFSGKLVLVLVKKSVSKATKSELHQCLEIFWKKLASL
jgi:ribonuclease P protein component